MVKYKCICGSVINTTGKSQHEKTQKHKKFIRTTGSGTLTNLATGEAKKFAKNFIIKKAIKTAKKIPYHSIVNKVVPRGERLKKGEIHPPVLTKQGWSVPLFVGPGTHFEEKIRDGKKPVNEIDRVARVHDSRYGRAKNAKNIRDADKKMIKKIKELWKSGDEYKINLLIAGLPIAVKMKLEDAGIMSADKFADFEKDEVEDHELIDNLIQKETAAGYGGRRRKKY